MPSKALTISARLSGALGFLSMTLTGEIAPAWVVAIWTAWMVSFACDRMTEFQSGLRRYETTAVIGMIVLLFVDFFIFHNTIFIAVTHFLLFFQMVKLSGEKARKDNLQIFLVSFFQILAACTLSVDAWHAAILLLFIPTATSALFWNQMEREWTEAGSQPDARIDQRYTRMAAGICMFALPLNILLTVIVFVIFPRLQLNASLPGFNGQRMGYTDQVNLSQTGALRQDRAVVMWLAFPRPEDRKTWSGYLRGDVLPHFDGRRWSRSQESRQRMLAPDSNGIFFIRPYQPSATLRRDSITLADPSANTLFTSGMPLRVMAPLPSLHENDEGTLHWTVPWRRPLHYEVLSEPYSDLVDETSSLELPTISLARIRDLAQKASGKGSTLEQAHHIEQYLKEHYAYSTNFGERLSENPVDSFLFERRQGACGHFASALALMLRLRNIPSRVVAGYFQGEWNEPAQCIVIRERHAHAWVEAYIKGKGWVALDPTPVPQIGPVAHRNILQKLEQYWDFLSYEWDRVVIQYDLYAQVKALQNLKGTWWPNNHFRFHLFHRQHERMEGDKAQSNHSLRMKEIAIFLALSVAAAILFFRRKESPSTAPIRFYNQFLRQMGRRGHPKAPQETGWEFVQRLTAEKPELRILASTITEKYYLLRFGMEKQ